MAFDLINQGSCSFDEKVESNVSIEQEQKFLNDKKLLITSAVPLCKFFRSKDPLFEDFIFQFQQVQRHLKWKKNDQNSQTVSRNLSQSSLTLHKPHPPFESVVKSDKPILPPLRYFYLPK